MHLELFGQKAKLKLEFDLGSDRTLSVDITDVASPVNRDPLSGWTDLMIPVRGQVERRVEGALDEVEYRDLGR